MKWRKITAEGQEYRWTFSGSGGEVRNGDGVKIAVLDGYKIRGHAAWERGAWKRTTDGMITPSDVASIIKNVNSPTAQR